MKLNLPKIHDTVTIMAVIGIALTFILQILSVSVGILSLSPIITIISVVITMGSISAAATSILLSLYRTATK